MAPKPMTPASWTGGRSGPHNILTLGKNLVELNSNCDYHRLVVLSGVHSPVHHEGGGSPKPTAHSHYDDTTDYSTVNRK